MAEIKGGGKFEKEMARIVAELERAGYGSRANKMLKVGFLSGATYPGTNKKVAAIAVYQNFGTYSGGRVGTRSKDYIPMFYSPEEVEKAHYIPPRPFFSNMVKDKSPSWPADIARRLRTNNYDVTLTLNQTGEEIKGQLRESIINTNEPPLAESTIRKKGFSKPLIETGHMLNSVEHEVE